ncbi:Ca2+-binding EF-hand superfamily protein [Luteibacter sp. Sphag1AF]|uniref:hypothetical protein n=1 Tax=Luteibacter sp. Sphag1AF TaxID=2587031 RepID=UPI0016185AB7|nr:hypothetical protein [Luteibacter sp. Sphag1AF]MBB3226057.1 Ca2+-binding EF-hand superfamily protein [Luteibacter sp. Sphag1AF]
MKTKSEFLKPFDAADKNNDGYLTIEEFRASSMLEDYAEFVEQFEGYSLSADGKPQVERNACVQGLIDDGILIDEEARRKEFNP